MALARRLACALALSGVYVLAEETCSADEPEACEGMKGASALQVGSSAAKAKVQTKTFAGVAVKIQGASPEDKPSDRHQWMIKLRDGCTNEHINSFAQNMPKGARKAFAGSSESGLCVFVLDGTEAQLQQELESHPGAESVQADFEYEQSMKKVALAKVSSHEKKMPKHEGFPKMSPHLLPAHEKPALAELKGAYRMAVRTDQPMQNTDNICGGPYMANVYFPAPHDGPKPLIVVGHGYQQGGHYVNDQLVTGWIQPLVEDGFVVIAHQTAMGWCDTSDELKYLVDWAKTSSYAARIDFDNVGAMGYSMGGKYALEVADDADTVTRLHIKAVAGLMPPCEHDCFDTHVPVYYGAGTADTTCSAELIHEAYEANTNKKVYVEIPGAPHWEVGVWGANRFTPSLMNFFRCELKGRPGGCDNIYNNPAYEHAEAQVGA